MFEELVEKFGVETIYTTSTDEAIRLAVEGLMMSAIDIASNIKGNAGIICFRKGRVDVLYGEKYAEITRTYKNKLKQKANF
jgi:hypothetical protein